MVNIDDCILVMVEAVPFHGLMQRHQHLARQLSKYLPVVYTEFTPSRLKFLLEGSPFDPVVHEYKRGLQVIDNNLFLFKAPPCSPRTFGFISSIRRTSRNTARELRKVLPDDKKVILWVSSPVGAPALGLYGEVLSIFDSFDAWGEFPGEERYRKAILIAMERLSRNADIVLATSPDIMEQHSKFNESTYLIRNGCDPDHFASGGSEPGPDGRLYDPSNLKSPVIGYMGDIAPWLDMECLYNVARMRPDWTVVLIGTWKREDSIPADLPNVIAPGRVEYNELPFYARKFDIGTIPFEMNDLTKAVNPLKLYEYFAMGLPVVSTPIPEVAIHEGLVYLASNPDEFLMLCDLALKETKESRAHQKRIDVAFKNSWDSRGIEIFNLMQEKLLSRG